MPRLGLGSIDLSAVGGSGDTVTTIDDFFFESFSAGEIIPMLTASRTNLITYSEDVSHNSWNKTNVQATSSIASPVSSASFLIKETSFSSSSSILQLGSGISLSAGTYTASFYVKKNTGRYLGIILGVSSQRIRTNFDFDTETFKTPNLTGETTGSASFEKDGDFYRISIKAVFPSTVAAVLGVVVLPTDTYPFFTNYDSDNRSFHVSGFQLEQDIFASSYIKTSGSAVTVSTTLNDTSEVWDFDSTDIMLEADPEDEGFWEEGSNIVLNGDYEELGSELVTNGDFSSFTGDIPDNFLVLNQGANNFVTESNGQLRMVSDNSATIAIRAEPTDMLTVGKVYEVSVDLTFTTGSIDISGVSFNTSGTKVFYVTAPATYLQIAKTSTLDVLIDNLSIKQVDPNDRWQLNAGWTIEDGKANFGGSGSATTPLIQNISLTNGNTYNLRFTVSNATGNASIWIGNGAGSINYFGVSYVNRANGTYDLNFTMTSTQSTLAFFANQSGSNFSLDNVTVAEYAIQPQDV